MSLTETVCFDYKLVTNQGTDVLSETEEDLSGD